MINCTTEEFLKDSKQINLVKVGPNELKLGTTNYGGNNYEFIICIHQEDQTDSRVLLFHLYTGTQLLFADTDSTVCIKESVSTAARSLLSSTRSGQFSLWNSIIMRINLMNNNTENYQPIPVDTVFPIMTCTTETNSQIANNDQESSNDDEITTEVNTTSDSGTSSYVPKKKHKRHIKHKMK